MRARLTASRETEYARILSYCALETPYCGANAVGRSAALDHGHGPTAAELIVWQILHSPPIVGACAAAFMTLKMNVHTHSNDG